MSHTFLTVILGWNLHGFYDCEDVTTLTLKVKKCGYAELSHRATVISNVIVIVAAKFRLQ